jgi:hypothetical protein
MGERGAETEPRTPQLHQISGEVRRSMQALRPGAEPEKSTGEGLTVAAGLNWVSGGACSGKWVAANRLTAACRKYLRRIILYGRKLLLPRSCAAVARQSLVRPE